MSPIAKKEHTRDFTPRVSECEMSCVQAAIPLISKICYARARIFREDDFFHIAANIHIILSRLERHTHHWTVV